MKDWNDYTEEEKNRACGRIIESLHRQTTIQQLSDRDLCAQFLDEVWANLKLNTAQEFLANELLTRFERCVGIERDEETGEIS